MATGKLLWAFVLLGIDLIIPVKPSLLYAVFTVIGLDFVTGIVKAKIKKIARTSEGYRKTITKFLQYFVAILLCYGAGKLFPEKQDILFQSAGFVMMFVIYIEVSSIFENLYEIDQNSPFSKYFIKPVLTILKFGIEKNPVKEAADKIDAGAANDPASSGK